MLRKYTLEYEKTSYSLYGKSFEDAVFEKDSKDEIIKDSGNKLFIDNRQQVVESEAEPDYIEAIQKSKNKERDMGKFDRNIENYLKALDKLVSDNEIPSDDVPDDEKSQDEDTGGGRLTKSLSSKKKIIKKKTKNKKE